MPLVQKPFGDVITFTRASTATFFDSTGTLQSAAINVPRLDYDPATLLPRGFLVEEQRTNLVTYSEEFDNAAWVKSATTVTSNAQVSPSGTLTADVLIADTATSEHICDQAFIAVAGTTYTISAFVKASGLTNIGLRFTVGSLWTGSVSPQVRFDLSSATASTISGTPSASSITFVGNGWYRVSMSVACTTNGTPGARLQLMSGPVNVFAGNGIDGVLVWGAQTEAGAFPTSYIPTTTTALTRSADAASVNTLSPWFNGTDGTLFGQVSLLTVSNDANRWVAALSDGTTSNYIGVFRQTDQQPVGQVQTSAVTQAAMGAGAVWTTTASRKLALSYATNDFKFCTNGGTVITDTAGTVPTVTQLQLGVVAATWRLNGWLERVTFYPRVLSSAELQALTA